MYDELIKRLRRCASYDPRFVIQDCEDAADAIEELQKQLREEKVDNVNLTGWLADEHAKVEELLKAAKAMHTWIFLNSVDEQAAYDECGLTDEMNVALGYGGQFVAEMSKEE